MNLKFKLHCASSKLITNISGRFDESRGVAQGTTKRVGSDIERDIRVLPTQFGEIRLESPRSVVQ